MDMWLLRSSAQAISCNQRGYFLWIPQYRGDARSGVLEVGGRGCKGVGKDAHWRLGEGLVKGTLASREFSQHRQVSAIIG